MNKSSFLKALKQIKQSGKAKSYIFRAITQDDAIAFEAYKIKSKDTIELYFHTYSWSKIKEDVEFKDIIKIEYWMI